jgi:hypothetical protein
MPDVTLTHKDLPDEEITVPETSAEVLKDSGWKPKPKSTTTTKQGS